MANEAERQRWSDPGQVANWHKRERFTSRVTPYVLAAAHPQPGERVLEIGPGTGTLGLEVARIIGPHGRLTGADISEGMARLAAQRARETGAKNATFTVADVQTASPPGGPFDLVVAQFSLMFFDEPLAAFTNIRRQLKPGGRIAFACWQEARRNLWHAGAPLAPFVPRPAPPPPGKTRTGPFSLGDPLATRKLLAAAGFVAIHRARRSLVVNVPADSIADEQQIHFMGIPEELHAAAREAYARHYAQFRRPDGLSRFELHFQVFTARNP